MLASGFMGNGQVAETIEATTTVAITATTTANLNNNKNYNLSQEVRKFTSDKPLMAEISRCESHFRQYEKDGSVLRGRVNNMDVGLFQINEYYHLERSKKLGYDIYSVEGNMAYARRLFNEEGPTPWSSSSPCWSKTTAYENYQLSNQLAVK
jgi:hypothetical protein